METFVVSVSPNFTLDCQQHSSSSDKSHSRTAKHTHIDM